MSNLGILRPYKKFDVSSDEVKEKQIARREDGSLPRRSGKPGYISRGAMFNEKFEFHGLETFQ